MSQILADYLLKEPLWVDRDFWHAFPISEDGVESKSARCGWIPKGKTRSTDVPPANRCPICDALSKEAGAQ